MKKLLAFVFIFLFLPFAVAEELTNCVEEYGSHQYTTESFPATCTDEGSTIRTCVRCGFSDITVLSRLPHTYIDGLCSICGNRLQIDQSSNIEETTAPVVQNTPCETQVPASPATPAPTSTITSTPTPESSVNFFTSAPTATPFVLKATAAEKTRMVATPVPASDSSQNPHRPSTSPNGSEKAVSSDKESFVFELSLSCEQNTDTAVLIASYDPTIQQNESGLTLSASIGIITEREEKVDLVISGICYLSIDVPFTGLLRKETRATLLLKPSPVLYLSNTSFSLVFMPDEADLSSLISFLDPAPDSFSIERIMLSTAFYMQK